MDNKENILEWLMHAYHDLEGAKILCASNHYTDTISYVVQQAIEKTLKSLLAHKNEPIKKTHNLVELYELASDEILVLEENEIAMIALATTYYIKQRYPTPYKKAVSRQEIKEVLDFAENLFERVYHLLGISLEEIKAPPFF